MPTQPFLALITPLGSAGGGGGGGGGEGGHPSHPWVPPPGYPSHPWVPPTGHPSHPWVPPPGTPTHPWVPPSAGGPGTPPLGIWGGGGVGNYPDAGFPGPQPGGPVYPSHPIYYPPGIWGGGGIGNYPDAGFPGPQPGGPVYPSHPIYYPPVIWDPSRPTNPIVNPGDPDHPGEGQPGGRVPKIEWKTAWSPTTGWVVVGVPSGEHPTPSEESSTL